jgi:hypothetical protein
MKRMFDETELALAIFQVMYKQEIARRAEVDLSTLDPSQLSGLGPYRDNAKPEDPAIRQRLERAAKTMYELETDKRLVAREMAEAAFALDRGQAVSRYTNTDMLKRLLGEVLGEQENSERLEQASEALGLTPRLVHHEQEWSPPIGFGPYDVKAGSTTIFSSHPQVPVRLKMVAMRAEIARHFLVNDVKVGKDSQFVNSNPVDAALIWLLDMEGAPCMVGQAIHLNVTNTSLETRVFQAAILCDAVW